MNGTTASMSEVLAGALRDDGRAVLVGTKTYGKGRTQQVLPLADNSLLLVSSNLITTPLHERIDKVR